MKDGEKEQDTKERNSLTKGIAIGVISTTLISYVIAFSNHSIANTPSEWGAFGDFFGGVFNPIIAAVALFYLIRSVDLQKTEMEKLTAEIKNTAVEKKTAQRIIDLKPLCNSTAKEIADIGDAMMNGFYENGDGSSSHQMMINQKIIKHLRQLSKSKHQEGDRQSLIKTLNENGIKSRLTEVVTKYIRTLSELKSLDPKSIDVDMNILENRDFLLGVQTLSILDGEDNNIIEALLS